jgi:hypothetical protein
MKTNIKERCPLCHQVHTEEEKDCDEDRLPLQAVNKDLPSIEPRMSVDSDTGAAIVSGHAEEG